MASIKAGKGKARGTEAIIRVLDNLYNILICCFFCYRVDGIINIYSNFCAIKLIKK